ncbi:siderochrome-iron transporter [Ophiostoma piceae UAMH 11346]|uniref:Siderochrome-iron transporter n=1 Tax=Ophiostoma piceae (strain UAMH 11346) TaxID=1262450 RepID=S3BYQ3_OPHP1|nr:siderochrome-iron transporter [Ophiostoma piceae UAMH 11346]
MSFINNLRGRNTAIDTHVIQPEFENAGATSGADTGVLGQSEKPANGNSNEYSSAEDSSRLSLEARDELEVQRHGDRVTADAQIGIQKAEAAALVWSRGTVIACYAWIWVCFFMLALQQSILSNVTVYAYASFKAAPQIATASILASVVGGVLKLPIAKVLNIWGRAEGFLIFIGVYLLGMIIIAACNGPDSYAAGYVLYWIGYDALYFIMDIFVADTSGLKNRAFAFAFVSTPFICTAFTGPLAAQAFLDHSTWRWGVGAFCIIQFFIFTPLALVFKFYQLKAEKLGLYVPVQSGRTMVQSFLHYTHEFDLVGGLILMAAWVLFLLPFSMTTNGRTDYHSATFIAMVVVGLLLFPVFAVWEKYFARVHFIRWELFKKRTVVGACAMACIVYYSFYAWDLYYYQFIIVVYDLSVTKTGYMTQIYNVGSCFWGAVFGVYVRYTKHFKWASLFFGLSMMLLGSGLMIRFRGQDSNIGYIVMCQIFIAFGGGTLIIGQSMAVMAAADRDGVPLMLAVLYLFNSFGGSIGYAVAQSIYTATFPDALRSRLPDNLKDQTDTIYLGGYLAQMEYAVGTPARDAINYAWGHSQKINCISSTAFLVLGIPAILLWKNYNVDRKQNKGNVL